MYNSSARIEKNEEDDKDKTPYMTKGNVTEQGIIKFFMNQFNKDSGNTAEKAGKAMLDAKLKVNEKNDGLDIVEFSSSRKRASIVVHHGDGVRIYTKGAPDRFELTRLTL